MQRIIETFKVIFSTLLILAFASGCSKQLSEQSCSSVEATATVPNLVRDSVLPEVMDQVRKIWRADSAFSANDQQTIKKGVTIALQLYHFISADKKVGSLHCGVKAVVSFAAPNGQHVMGQPVDIAFDVFPGKTGPVYYVDKRQQLALASAFDGALVDIVRSSTDAHSRSTADDANGGNTDLTALTEAELNHAYRCPEAIKDQGQKQQGGINMLKWYAAHYTDTSPAALLRFRVNLLKTHHCDQTLKNILAGNSGSNHPQDTRPLRVASSRSPF